MAKRFTATEIWDEDWFLAMPSSYKLFWFFILSTCDHAGVFRVNLRSFCGLNEVKVTSEKALEYFNSGKDRIRIVNQSVWLIEDFFVYQYGTTFNPNNRVHESIESVYNKLGVKMTSIRGLLDLKDRVKDKDKDKDKDSIINTAEIKKIIHGISFTEDMKSARMSDGTIQELTLDQIRMLKEGGYEPHRVKKNK